MKARELFDGMRKYEWKFPNQQMEYEEAGDEDMIIVYKGAMINVTVNFDSYLYLHLSNTFVDSYGTKRDVVSEMTAFEDGDASFGLIRVAQLEKFDAGAWRNWTDSVQESMNLENFKDHTTESLLDLLIERHTQPW